MRTPTTPRRAATVATGATAVVASLGGSLVLAGPAEAVAAPDLVPATCAPVSVTGWNAALPAAALKSKAYLKQHAKTVALKKAWGKAKGKQKAIAKKKYLASLAAEKKIKAAFVAAGTFRAYTSAPFTGPAVHDNGRGTDSTWGAYTTRILTKGSTLVDICTSVVETGLTPEDEATSKDIQGIAKGLDPVLPGTLPVLWRAALAAPARTKAAIEANVTTCATTDYTLINAAVCPVGGLVVAPGGYTGATYTVASFKGSLQDALTQAKAAHVLG